MEAFGVVLAAALAVGLPALATAWAQSRIGPAIAASMAEKPELSTTAILMIAIFIFAYFKFTWALRQYNFLSILIGSAPPREDAAALLESHARRFAALSTLSGDEFNRGIRAYYFGFAALAWFVAPAVFMAFTFLILGVLYRRDFRSATLDVLAR